jgi:hypothetical protein
MAEKLTMKLLAEELDTLRKQLTKLETRFERKLETALEKAAEKLKSRLDSGEGLRHGRAVDVDARRRLIEQCAYLRAERRGFVGGDPHQDWLDAEMEVDALLLQGWTKDDTASTGETSEPPELKPVRERRI